MRDKTPTLETGISKSDGFSLMFTTYKPLKDERVFTQVGVSLVEVLAAVFILGLMSSLAVLSFPQSTPPERQYATALAGTIREGIDRSILLGAPVAIDLRDNVIQVLDWKHSSWVQVVPFRIDMKGKLITQQIEPHDPYRDESKPELICDPTGLVSPATFSVTGKRERWEIIVSASGKVSLEQR